MIAKNQKQDPLEAKVMELVGKVDDILLDPAFKSGGQQAMKVDRVVPIVEFKGATAVQGASYTRLIDLMKEAKGEIEQELPSKPVEVMENVIGTYLTLQNRLYTNFFGNLHKNHSSKLLHGPDQYEALNLRFPVTVGDALMIGRVTRFEANIWHIESKPGSGVYDKVELGVSPFEKVMNEDTALTSHMSYQNYAKTVLFRILQQRVTNLWSISRMDPLYQNTKVQFKGCGYHTASHRYSSKSHFPSYYDFLFRGDIYGDLVHSDESPAIYNTLFAPVTSNPILTPAQVGGLLKTFFLKQESFKLKTARGIDRHWIDLWEKSAPTKYADARADFWSAKMDSVFKTANYPMDDWSETGISNRIAEIAYHSEAELIASFLLNATRNESGFISEFNPEAKMFYIKPEISRDIALKLVEDSLAPVKDQWLAATKKGIIEAAKSPLVNRVRAGKAERRFEDHYQDLVPVLGIAARAQKIKTLAYSTYNQQKLNWEDQKLLLKANYSTNDPSMGRFLKDQWQKLTFGKSRSEREDFERNSVDEALRMDLYDTRNDQLGLIPATVLGNHRLSPIHAADLKALYDGKLATYRDSKQSGALKDLATAISKDKIAGEFIEGFFESLGNDFDTEVQKVLQSSVPGVQITEKNTPLFRLLAAKLNGLMKQYDSQYLSKVDFSKMVKANMKEDLRQSMTVVRDNTYVAIRPLPKIIDLRKPVFSPPKKPAPGKPAAPQKQQAFRIPYRLPEQGQNTAFSMSPLFQFPLADHQIPLTDSGSLKGPYQPKAAPKAAKEPSYQELTTARDHIIQAFALLGLEGYLKLENPTPNTLVNNGVSLPLWKAKSFTDRNRYLTSKFKPATMADLLGQSLLDQKLIADAIIERITERKPILNLSLNSGEAMVDRNYHDTTYTTLQGIAKKAYSFTGGIDHALARSYLKLGIRNAVTKLPAEVREACSAHGMFNGTFDKKGNLEDKGFLGSPGDIYDDYQAGDGWVQFKNIYNSAYSIRTNLVSVNKDWGAYDNYWAKETRTKTDKILTEIVKPASEKAFNIFLGLMVIELAPIAWYGAQGFILNGAGWAGIEYGIANAGKSDAIGWLVKKFAPKAARYLNGKMALRATGLFVDAAFLSDYFLIHHIAYVELPQQLKYQVGIAHSSLGDATTVNPIKAKDLKEFAAKIHGAQLQSFISGLINIPVGWSLYRGAKSMLKRPEAEALERLVAYGGKDAETLSERLVNPNIKNSGTAAKELVTKLGVKVFKDGAKIMDMLELQALATAKTAGIETLDPMVRSAIDALEKEYSKVWSECKAFADYANGVSESIKVEPYNLKLKDRFPKPPKLGKQLWAAKWMNRKQWNMAMSEFTWNEAVNMDKEGVEVLLKKWDAKGLAGVKGNPDFYKDIATLLMVKRQYLLHLEQRGELLMKILDELEVYQDRAFRIGNEQASREFYVKLFTSDPKNASEFYQAFKVGFNENFKQPWYSKRLMRRISKDAYQYREINRLAKDYALLMSQFTEADMRVYQLDVLEATEKMAQKEADAKAADEAMWQEWVDIDGNVIRYRAPPKGSGSGPTVEVTGSWVDVEWEEVP
ncbi:MAG: hypothetical protein EBX52_00745 [Proteobacteria bacterium]|nr:hypothetical protein [Pseudomonadota bacterium]